MPDVGEGLRTAQDEYLRDLAAVEGDPCFFTAMGERAAARAAMEGQLG